MVISLIKRKIKSALNYMHTFLKWVIIAAFTGVIGGAIGSLFSILITRANEINHSVWWLVFLLPVGGVVITALYKLCHMENDPGTNCVIESIRSKDKVPMLLAPLIFCGTVITHFFGGSAGREGAALQLGGSIGSVIGRVLHLDDKDMHVAVLCGMSALFSALFGTPVAAAFFALEVISVGVAYYSALVPCFTASVSSYFILRLFGISPLRFDISKFVPEFNIISVLQTVGLAVVCAVVSIVFCVTMHKTHLLAKMLFKNEFVRVIVGGTLIIALTFLVGCRDYNGAGSHIIANALNGNAKIEAFALKIIFTAITIGFGFKGGEIVPTLFIGSTLGCVVAPLLGMNPAFGASLGLICLFTGVVNCPMAAILLSVEIFGAQGIILFATGCAVSYMLSGYYGLYSSQKIMYSKLKAEFININAK